MASADELIFSTMQPSLAEVEVAVGKVKNLIATKTVNKQHFFEMLAGFRTLENSVKHKEPKSYELTINWLRLYLKIQSSIDIKDDKLGALFQKTVPPAMTYIIGCLQHKSVEMHSFHYQLLELVHDILKRVPPGVVEKLATFETGIIACLWFPIDFVGDFNTQMLALRLLVLLLKCVDSVRRQHELDRIRCAQTHVLRDKLSTAIAVANYHAGKFENTARELLNSYNMNMAQNVLVYSLRCETFKLNGKYEFIKPLNAEDFWIDFNYCPRTLTFNGRYKAKDQSRYANCAVLLNVLKMSLGADKLIVEFRAPAVFSKKLRGLPSISDITMAKLILPRDEALRLRENNFVLKYYNNQTRSSTEIDSDASSDLEDNTNNTINASNKENVPPPAKHEAIQTQIAHTRTTAQTTNNKVGQHSNTDTKEMDTATDNDFIEASQSPPLPVRGVVKKCAPAAKKLAVPTADKGNNDAAKLIRKPQQKRFFKTRRVSADTDFSPRTHLKLCKRRSRRRKGKTGDANAMLPKRKQINKVKPMTHFPLTDDVKIRNNDERRTTDQSTIINITNFLDDGNESAAVFNQLQRRTIVENVERAFAAGTAAREHATIAAVNKYEKRNSSDAETRQSYRSFGTPCLPGNRPQKNKRRTRKTMQRSTTTKKLPTPQQLVVATATDIPHNPRVTRKRASAKTELFNAVEAADEISAPAAKSSRLIATKTGNINKNNRTVYSTDIDVDLTCTAATMNAVTAPTAHNISQKFQNVTSRCAGMSQQRQIGTDVPQTPTRNFTQEASQLHRSNDAAKPYDGLIQDKNQYAYQQKVPSLLGNSKDGAAAVDADIELCRHDAPTNLSILSPLHIQNEFSDCESPEVPNMMSISDFLQLSDNESGKSMKIKQTLTENQCNLSSEFKSTEQTTESRNDNFTNPNECIMYHQRSECDSDSDHNQTYDSFDDINIPERPVQTPQLPPSNFGPASKCCVTTTATAIITHQDGVISQQVVVNAQVNTSGALTESRKKDNSLDNTNLGTTNCDFDNMLAYIRHPPREFMAVTPRVLKQESSNILTVYKDTISSYLSNVRERFKDKQTAAYIKKVTDIGERVTGEIERERKEILDLEGDIERITRQLDWQFEAYQRKLQQFECFKQNIDNVVKVLSAIDVTKKVETEREQILKELLHTSKDMRSNQWRNFINDSTESLLKNITTLSNI